MNRPTKLSISDSHFSQITQATSIVDELTNATLLIDRLLQSSGEELRVAHHVGVVTTTSVGNGDLGIDRHGDAVVSDSGGTSELEVLHDKKEKVVGQG